MQENNKIFEQSFKEFIVRRVMEGVDILPTNKKLKEMNAEADLYYEATRTTFADSNQEAFEKQLCEYRMAQAAIGGVIAEIAYMQGMKDAYQLIKLFEGTGGSK
jgi:hypothetical protein